VFLTVQLPVERARQRVALAVGAVPGLERFTVCRQGEDPFWMVPAAGEKLSQVPTQTQWLLARLSDGGHVMLVPLFGEEMTFTLEGKATDTLELLGETNDAATVSTGGLALFVAAGPDPYELVARGARSVIKRLGGGKLRQQKAVPAFADVFGWCTWDAFYGEVSHDKVKEGLESFAAAGLKPRALVLDDGWQTVKPCRTGGNRLSAFEANGKFPGGLKNTVDMAREGYGVEHFMVWHAVNGYWGGLDPEAMAAYAPVEVIPRGGKHVNVNWIMDLGRRDHVDDQSPAGSQVLQRLPCLSAGPGRGRSEDRQPGFASVPGRSPGGTR
jgi:raffinose synthase